VQISPAHSRRSGPPDHGRCITTASISPTWAHAVSDPGGARRFRCRSRVAAEVQQSDLRRNREARKSRVFPTSRAKLVGLGRRIRHHHAVHTQTHGSARPRRAASFGFRTIEGTSGRWACLRRWRLRCGRTGTATGSDRDGTRLPHARRRQPKRLPELLYTVTAVRRSWAESKHGGHGCVTCAPWLRRLGFYPRSRPP